VYILNVIFFVESFFVEIMEKKLIIFNFNSIIDIVVNMFNQSTVFTLIFIDTMFSA